MKLLKASVNGFKNCIDDFSIDFVAKSKKTSEDKEYELQEISDDLFTYNTTAIIGKNASGKTSAFELLEICYSILGYFEIKNSYLINNNINIKIWFHHLGYIYLYEADLKKNKVNNEVTFHNEMIFKKKYFKTKINDIFNFDTKDKIVFNSSLPNKMSELYFEIKERQDRAIVFESFGYGALTYKELFNLIEAYNIDSPTLEKVIKLFDSNIKSIERVDETHFKLNYNSRIEIYSNFELARILSSGTTKGILLYMYAIVALNEGYDLVIDEIENHFHKTLVENLISLFKDKMVNKKNATLIFTTHYIELLDTFSRQDNIWICKSNGKIEIENMYLKYNIRPELLKSKQYYNDTFNTSVSYDDLMELKKELMK